MNINFEYYKVFYIIAKNKNITNAAKELNISQPAISRILKTMEAQLNTKLFIRKPRGVILTQEGNELYRLIANNIDNIINAENEFLKVINSNSIKIAGDKNYLTYLVENNKLDNILKDDLNISFLEINDFETLNSQLINNLIDFAFIVNSNNFQFDNQLIFKKIEKLHYTFVSNVKNNPNNKPIILFENSNFKNLYYEHTDSKFQKFITVNDYNEAYSLIHNGYGNGFLIKEFIHKELKNNELYEIELSSNLPNISIGIIYNVNNELKVKQLLTDFIE